jgi:hypothetical protein
MGRRGLINERPFPPSHGQRLHSTSQRGKHFVLRTSSIEDIEEVADWARSWLTEPAEPLDKARRQAFQNVVERAGRHVHLSPIGPCHFIATGWKR